ncbi:MAG: hypothetical protein GTO18_20225 [Anaerolineales bacterium]|nr:hypothetical protein [Anaerolineales bacterium]
MLCRKPGSKLSIIFIHINLPPIKLPHQHAQKLILTLVIFSLLISNFTVIVTPSWANELKSLHSEPAITTASNHSGYEPPTFKHQEPRMGQRPEVIPSELMSLSSTSDSSNVFTVHGASKAGITDGTYYYPIAAYLHRATSGGFVFENGENAAGFADDAVVRGHYTVPGASVWFLTLDFGGVVTAPGGDWMYSKTGSFNDPTLDHNPWWAHRRTYYSLDGIHWPDKPWPGGEAWYFPYAGSWPAALTGDGSTQWTVSNQDGTTIPAGAKFRFLRLRLHEGRGIAPLEGWEGYNEVELFFDAFRIIPAAFETIVTDWSTYHYCLIDACFGSAIQGSQAYIANPINTRTGGYDFSVEDLSFSTPAGRLNFQRTYTSKTTGLYTSLLGFGWTHNHDIRLIFPDDPEGRLGVVLFKAHAANLYEFFDKGDGTFVPYPGLNASLTRIEGPPLTYTLVDKAQQAYTFDETGKLLTRDDSEGHTWTYTYDVNGLLETVTDETSQRFISLNYDVQDRISSVTDHSDRLVSFTFDAAGDLISAVDVHGETWSYVYDTEHHLTEVLDPNGVVLERTEYEPDIPAPLNFNDYEITSYAGSQDQNPTMTIEDAGRTLHIVGNGWKKIEFPYNITKYTVMEFDYASGAEGDVQGIGFDNDDALSTNLTFQLYGTQGWGLEEFHDYADTAPDWKHYEIPVGDFYTGDMVYLFFANDHDVTTPTAESYFSNIQVYDAGGRALRQYNGEGELVVELVYSHDGTTTVTDSLGNSETHSYDGRNTLTDLTDPSGGTSNKVYDDNFRPSELVDEDGDMTQFAWSDDGSNLIQVIDAEGGQIDLTYDSLNNLTEVINPRGFLTSYTYDGTLLTSTTDALGNTTTYSYTLDGYLASVTDPLGNTTSYTYDEDGQRTSMTNALGNTWSYSYDELGNLVDTTDPLGRITHNEYDAAGHLVRMTRNYDPIRPQNDEDQYNIVTEYGYDNVGNQIMVTDTMGRTTRYEYDDANRLVRTIDPAGYITTNTYNEAGILIATADALGRTTTYTYDELNRLVTTTDPLGNTTTTTYNLDSTVASTTDALGHTTTFVYDDLKRVVATTDPLGNTTTTTHDEIGNIVATTDTLGNTTTYEYDALERLIRQIDPLGGITEHFYDEVGNLVQTIDPNGSTTTNTYDDLNRLTYVTDALGNTTSYAYDSVGNRTSVTDANGNSTTYVYDQLDRIVEIANPLGHSTRTVYDALGNVITSIDANGNPTKFKFDILNRLVRQVDPLAGETRYTYDAVGNQLTVTDANEHTSTTVFDGLNRPVSLTDPLGHTNTSAYDAVGNIISMTDALGNVTNLAYDELKRLESITDPEGNVTSYTYDAVGNRTAMTDAIGVTTHYEYDGLNRLTAVLENEDPLSPADSETNVRTEYTYDAVGNRLTLTDANGHVTSFTYDAINRMTSESDPLGNTTLYEYDPVGSQISLEDPEGFITYFQYDAADRLIQINYPAPDSDVTFTNDAVGNRLSMIDGVGTTTWTYDNLNRPIQITDPFGDTVQYSYDNVGNRSQLIYPGGAVVTYFYDAANRMTGVQDWEGQTTTYGYDAANRPSTISLPNGVITTYSHDAAGRLLSINHRAAGLTLSSFYYTYDGVGNRIEVIEAFGDPDAHLLYFPLIANGATMGISASEDGIHLSVAASPQPQDEIQAPTQTEYGLIPRTITYTYDPLHRLTAAEYSTGEFFRYAYDPVGNRMSQETVLGTNTYAYDDVNRLIEVDGQPYSWDDNGNLLSDDERTYTYDHANRLTGVVEGGIVYSFAYNGLGDRLQQRIDGVTMNYTLDLNAALTQILADTSNSYLYGVERIGEKQPGGWAYYLTDALSSVRQLTDSGAIVGQTRSYDPFGDSFSKVGEGDSSYGFTGEWMDTTGLVHLRARYYSPSQGRFISRDSLQGNAIRPMSYNDWLYVYANPINLTDPSGHDPWWCDYLFESRSDRVKCKLNYLASMMDTDQQSSDPSTLPSPTGAGMPPPACIPIPPYPIDPSRSEICPVEAGHRWEEVTISKFRLSVYYRPHEVQPDFNMHKHELVSKEGIPFDAKYDFLFGRGGIAMQGSGYLQDGRLLVVDNGYDLFWEYSNKYKRELIANPDDARFSFSGGKNLTAFKNAAVPFALDSLLPYGTKICLSSDAVHRIREIGPANHNGIFVVNDRCPGCYMKGGTYGVDMYAGAGQSGKDFYLDWFGGQEYYKYRLNQTIFRMVPGLGPIGRKIR